MTEHKKVWRGKWRCVFCNISRLYRRQSSAELGDDVLFAQFSCVTPTTPPPSYLRPNALVAAQLFPHTICENKINWTQTQDWILHNASKILECIFEIRARQMFVPRFSRPVSLRTPCPDWMDVQKKWNLSGVKVIVKFSRVNKCRDPSFIDFDGAWNTLVAAGVCNKKVQFQRQL